MDKESLIHKAPSSCDRLHLPPTRRLALLLQLGLPHRSAVHSRLRPPLVPAATGRPHISWSRTKAWKSNLRLCWRTSNTIFIFLTSSHSQRQLLALFICHYYRCHLQGLTVTHARLHILLLQGLFDSHTVHTFSINLFNAVLAKDSFFVFCFFWHICNLTPLIQWIGICNFFILNYACFVYNAFFLKKERKKEKVSYHVQLINSYSWSTCMSACKLWFVSTVNSEMKNFPVENI